MISFFKKGLTFLLVVLFLFVNTSAPVNAATPPGFATCTNPNGEVISESGLGEHGIAGGTSKEGTDTVYAQNGGATQCFCANPNGIQTNWWKIPQSMSFSEIDAFITQGWIFVPNGADWGLDDASYLALNINYSCSGTSSSSTSSSNNPPICTDKAPGSAPTLLSATQQGPNSVLLTWTEAADPVSYYLVAYGVEPGKYIYGNSNVGGKGTTSYLVTNLSGGVQYYFVVRAGNGCAPGPFSNELGTSATGGTTTGSATNFTPGVLGAETDGTKSGEVKSFSDFKIPSLVGAASACANCIWWPIILGEIIALIALYAVKREDMSKNRVLVGFGIGVIALIIWWLLNRTNCADGGINLIIITLPCWLFFLLDAIVFAIITAILGRKAFKNSSNQAQN